MIFWHFLKAFSQSFALFTVKKRQKWPKIEMRVFKMFSRAQKGTKKALK